MRSCLAATALLALAPSSVAQLSSDAASNLVVAGAPYSEVRPKLAVRGDGGFYVSWFANDPSGSPAGGWDVRLQRFDASGHPQWGPGGVLIADRGLSFTLDHGLDVDLAGNALLSFRDDRPGVVGITATKVSSEGVQLWGPGGVQLVASGTYVADPKIAATSDGHAYVAWTHGIGMRVQRLDPSGASAWATDVSISADGQFNSLVDLKAASDGTAIFSFARQVGGGAAPRWLFANKVGPAQVPLWGAGHVRVFDGGGLAFLSDPELVTDDAGGAAFAWYSITPTVEVRAQRVDAAGNELFPHNGVTASTDTSQLRSSPTLAFDASEQELIVAYTELDAGQTQLGVSAQAFGPTGARLWGPAGVTIVPLAATQVNALGVASLEAGPVEGAAVIHSNAGGSSTEQLLATRLDSGGAPIGTPTTLASPFTSKNFVQVRTTASGNTLVVWQDEVAGNSDVLVQNLLPTGALGGVPTVTPLLGSGLNPHALQAPSGPHIGHVWPVGLDTSSDPTALLSAVFVYGQALPAPVLLPEGELLVDVTSPLAAKSIKTSGLTVDAHPFPVPAVIAYVGITVHAQGAILGLGTTTLTNGLSATVGL